ncbi:uncharacterized protein LOC130641713 [Hydractinia symbiolongicarpus]|uniref:uncharacterized protein LOC130641713 n=1 Tax=Hydractinia symbiolongicarpus TaxID=13093 RepID=UPI00254BB2DE|nr:uncharacterized protein LOC130641713 [Hydractinia symbiolongicarpus]
MGGSDLVLSNATSVEIAFESGIFFSTLSIATFTLTAILLFFYSQDDKNSLGTPTNLGILFFGCLTTLIADIIVHNIGQPLCYNTYMFIKITGFGILIMLIAPRHLFTRPVMPEDEPIGAHHKSVSFIIWVITIPLVTLEIAATVVMSLPAVNIFSVFLNTVAILQKLIQAGVYHFSLRHQVPIANKKCGASWFFKIMALFNFSMWMQSIIEAEKDFEVPLKEKFFLDILTVIGSTYSALMIDYRLLCCLLFLEHAYEIDYVDCHEHTKLTQNARDSASSYTNLPDESVSFYTRTKRMNRYGYLVGTLILLSQFLNALEYIHYVGPWVNIFGVFGELSVLILGYMLIKQIRPGSKSKSAWRETNSKGVDLMVAMMGVTGLAFWLLKSVLITIWTTRTTDDSNLIAELPSLKWLASKAYLRSFGCVFQIYLYIRVDLSLGYQPSIRYNKFNHFLLPCLMLSFLSVFTNSVIDSYHAVIKKFVHESSMHIVLYAFYEAGIPIHLGFVLHLFIHYLLINNKMRDVLAASEKRYRVDSILAKTPEEKDNLTYQNDEERDTNDDDDDRLTSLLGEGKKFRSI